MVLEKFLPVEERPEDILHRGTAPGPTIVTRSEITGQRLGPRLKQWQKRQELPRSRRPGERRQTDLHDNLLRGA